MMKKIACLDIGLKRIGVAFCFQKEIILPQNAIQRKNRNQASTDVKKLLDEWNIEKLVVGMPFSGGSCEEMQRRIKHFVKLIDFSGNIVFIDEYGTSMEAKEKLKGINRYKKDGKIDSIAACIILQRYFEKNIF